METLALIAFSCLRLAPTLAPHRWLTLHATAAERVGILTGSLALLLVGVSHGLLYDITHTWTFAILSLALVLEAVQRRSQSWFVAFQAGLILTVVSAVTAFAHPLGWLADARGPQAYGVGLAVLSLAWVAARRVMARRSSLMVLLPSSSIGLDRLTLAMLVVGVVLSGGIVAGAGVLAEWDPNFSTEVWAQLFGPGTWLLLAILSVALLAMLIGPPREEENPQRKFAVVSLVVLVLATTCWWAGMHIVDRAGASALRWGLAGCFLGGSILLASRQSLARLVQRVGLASTSASGEVRVLLGATTCVVVFLTVILTGLGFNGDARLGPLPASVFAEMGTILCGIGPMVLVIAGLIGTAVRDRSAGYALAAGLLTTATAMGGYALGVVQAEVAFDGAQGVLTILIGSGVAGACGLAWLLCILPLREPVAGPLLGVQAWLGLVGTVGLAIQLLPGLLNTPGLPPEPIYQVLGGPVGWLALLLSTASALWYTIRFVPRSAIDVGGLFLWVAGILAGSLARSWDTATVWLSYHVLAGSWSILAVVICVAGSLVPLHSRRWQVLLPARRLRRWLAGLAALLTLLAIRGAWDSLSVFGTPVIAALSASMLMGTVALWFRKGGFVYPSGLLFALATFLNWLAWGPPTFAAGVLSIVIGLAMAAAFWQAIALPQLRLGVANMRWPGPPFSPIATTVVLGMLVLVVGLAVGIDAVGEPSVTLGAMGWASFIAVCVALFAALADTGSRLARPGFYLLGLVLAGMVLHALSLSPTQLAWAGTVVLALHILLVSLLAWAWPTAEKGTETVSRLELPVMEREWPWLLPAQTAVAAMVSLLAFAVAVSLPVLQERVMAPLAIMLLVPAALLLSRVAPVGWPEWMRQAAAGCAAWALAALALAVPDPAGVAPWLQRDAWLLAALTVSTVAALQAGVIGLSEQVVKSMRPIGLVMGWMAVLLAFVLIGQMFPLFDRDTKRHAADRAGNRLRGVGAARADGPGDSTGDSSGAIR